MIVVKGDKKILMAQKQKEALSVFLDMDEVLCNWIKAACLSCNIDINNKEIRDTLKETGDINSIISNRDLWPIINKQGEEWWANLEIFPWAKYLYNRLQHETNLIFFLSSPSREPSCYSGKAKWLLKHFGKAEDFIPTKHKWLLANSHSLLIDDYQVKLDPFIEKGGYGFKWPSSLKLLDGELKIEKVIDELFDYIHKIKDQL